MTAAFPLSPLVDAARPEADVAATLHTSLLYEMVAPASTILDAWTMLSPAQYWATFALCAILIVGGEIFRDTRKARCFRPLSATRTCVRFLGGTVAVLGIMLLLSRPMASIRVSDPDLVVVDFHSHTSASHDGRAGFDAERNRDWHRAAGFDVVYITDHRTFEGAIEGAKLNPPTAGGGTTILPGVELRDGPEHPILIGADPRRMKIASANWRASAVKADGGPVPPILILSMPGDLSHVPAEEYTGKFKLAAIEGADGSPRGIAQTTIDEKRIVGLANRMGLAVVSGSDNHGWAQAAPAWSILRIPGWRALTPGALDVAIRRTILAKVPGSIRVITRRMAVPAPGRIETALDGVAVTALMFRTMNLPDRLSWLAWSWGLALLPTVSARRRRRNLILSRRAERRAIGSPPLVDAAAAMEIAS